MPVEYLRVDNGEMRLRHNILVTVGLILLWSLTVIAVVFAEAFWFAHPAVVRGDLASIENHLVRKLNDASEDRRLGSAALVLVHDGKIAARHGFGVANAETRSPVKTDQTLYQMASVSKAVTAWGIMKLVEEGRLGLDEPVMRRLKRWRFPGSDARRDKVTVRHLLSHTAGLDEGLGLGGFLPGEKIQTLEEALSSTSGSTAGEPHAVTVAGEPGTGMAYGNANYAVLQLLIEEVTRQSFADYMKEAVLQPLGMTKASFDLDAIASAGREQDLAPNFDSGLSPQPRRRYTATAAVALYATAEDMAQFARAFAGENPVLKQETLKQMMMPQPGTAGTWGLGLTLFVENDAGGHVVGHDGGAYPAWGAMVRTNPATGNGFILMVSGSQGAVNQLGHDWVYWETGKVTFEARRQIAYGRAGPASVAIILGAVVIMLWKLSRYFRG
ncbi:MAG TPA: serine hydrolase domain-containing protein [Pyrinomonadaceae bacterium]